MPDTGINVGPSVTKKPWESKTVIINSTLALVSAIAYFIPSASAISDWINANGVLIASLWGVLNVFLRLLTKNAISLTD